MGRNKLVLDMGGRPLLRRVADAALASAARPVIVVTGSEAESVEATLKDMPVVFVRNPDFATGMSSSLIRGLDALPEGCDGVVVLLGDMPFVSAATIDALIAAFAPEEGRAICVATHRGKRGNPVLFGRGLFGEICNLRGDVGAKSVVSANAELVCEVEMPDDAPLLDIDTPEALAAQAGRYE